MQMPITQKTTTFDSDGRIFSVFHFENGTHQHFPYRGDHAFAHNHPHTPTTVVQHQCPFCHAPLFMDDQATYCVNMYCAPRRDGILLRSLQHLNLPPAIQSELTLIYRDCKEPATLLQLLGHVKPASGKQIRSRLHSLGLLDYLYLIQTPVTYLDHLEGLIPMCKSVKDFHNGVLQGTLRDPAYVHSLAAVRLAQFVNSGFAEGLVAHITAP